MFKNFIWAFIEKGGQFFIQFISVVILSRFITPEEYGTYGIMAVFIAVSELLIDSGFGGALVHKKRITQKDINTLFVSNFAISVLLYAILYILAPIISNYYGINELIIYIRVLGLTIIFYSLTIVHYTLLQRELKFKKSANITVIASLLTVFIVVVLAILDFGIWALILQPLLMAIFTSVMLWSIEKRNIRIEFSKASFKILWSFGSKLLVANLLQTLYNNISTSIIPKIATVRVSGFYYQAYRLNSIPSSMLQMTVDKATFPMLTKEIFDDNILQKAREMNAVLFFLFFPLFPLLSLMSIEVINMVLGSSWVGASAFLSVLAFGGWGTLLQALYRNIFKSVGDTKTILKIDFIRTIIGFCILGLSVFFGVTFLIWGLTVSMYIGAICYMISVHKRFSFTLGQQLNELKFPILTTVMCYVCFYPIEYFSAHEWYNLLLLVPYICLYILINKILKNPIYRTLRFKIAKK